MIYYRILFLIILFSSQVLAQSSQVSLEQPFRITERCAEQHISLSGSWQLSYKDTPVESIDSLKTEPAYITTEIPSSVQWSLYRSGKLPHPYANLNSYQYRWIDKKVWYYSKTVHVDKKQAGKLAFLSFDGLDYFSRVWVNDTLLGSHEGMFGGPVVEISRLLRYGGDNTIIVELKSGRTGREALNAEDVPRNDKGEIDRMKINPFNPYANGDIIRPWALSGGVGTEPFYVMGFWKTARIDFVGDLHLERPYLITKSLKNDGALLQLSYELFANDHTLKHRLYDKENHLYNPSVSKEVIRNAGDITVVVNFDYKGTAVHTVSLLPEVRKGRNFFDQEIVLPDPKLWQPNNMGVPELYTVTVILKDERRELDRISFKYGVRTIGQVPSSARRTGDRWSDWQFVINGIPTFIKGMNWTTLDVLNDHNEASYRWALESMRDMGVQLVRVWGGALLETETFYNLCNELGIMVWQDFPLGNRETAKFDLYKWEAQVVHNITRLRNHPSLAIWCGGNEFNPYIPGNAGTTGVVERSLSVFDPSRTYFRASPDNGSVHLYPDIDPARAGDEYAEVAWISELGMHSMPDADMFRELVAATELKDLGKMLEPDFHKNHPDFLHHFTEYAPHRVPRMLSRASHIIDLRNPTMEDLTEATQVGAGEWYQIVSEEMQANYPVTTGLMPWVFKRHWPVTAIQLMDWFGQPTAPYYFLRRTYQPVHVAVDFKRLLYKPGELLNTPIHIVGRNVKDVPVAAKAILTVYDDSFKKIKRLEADFKKTGNRTVEQIPLPAWKIPDSYSDRILFVLGELMDEEGKMIARAQYNLRVLEQMKDSASFDKYSNRSVDWPTLGNGPWLKTTVAKTKTTLELKLLSQETGSESGNVTVRVKNTGKLPSYMTRLDITGAKRVFRATDNFFWLAPGEERQIQLQVRYREPIGKDLRIEVYSWNAKAVAVMLANIK